MTLLRIKPADGKRVRDPAAGFDVLPPGGKVVELDSFWARRLADGDVEVVDEPAPDAPASEG